jgi:hypothetical protein
MAGRPGGQGCQCSDENGWLAPLRLKEKIKGWVKYGECEWTCEDAVRLHVNHMIPLVNI